MRLLLDTNIIIPVVDEGLSALTRFITVNHAREAELHVSVASVWEIAIKARTGRLVIKPPPSRLPFLFEDMRFSLLPINHHHVLAVIDPDPPTRDPFDRLLLAQCAVEDLRLVTIDRALVNHPFAYQVA